MKTATNTTEQERAMTYKQTPMCDIMSMENDDGYVYSHKVEITLLDGQKYYCECNDANEAIVTANQLSELLGDFIKE